MLGGGGLAQAFVRLRVDSSQVAADTSAGIKKGAAAGDVESAGAGAGKKFGAAFSSAVKTAMALGLGAAVAIGVESVRAATEFQSQMVKIRTQAGASEQSIRALSKAVLQLAPSTQQGPQQLAEALYHLKSLGMDNADAMKALKTASDLAAVGGANLEATTNALGAAWRSGIAGAQDFGTAAATVNAIIGAGNMKMEDFVSALSSGILPAAKTFGLSLKQVGAAMAVMTDEGIPAQLAATRLRMSLSLLGAPSKQAETNLKQIGLTGMDLANAMRTPGGLVTVIGLLKQHIKDAGLTAAQTAELLSRSFGGGQSSSAILTLISNFGVLKLKQDQINAGIGRYGSAVARQKQTAEAQLHLLGSAFQTLGIQIGNALLPPLTKFVQFIDTKVMPKVTGLGKTVAAVLGKLGLGGSSGAKKPAVPSLPGAAPILGSGTGSSGGSAPVIGAQFTPAQRTKLSAAQQQSIATASLYTRAATGGAPPVIGNTVTPSTATPKFNPAQFKTPAAKQAVRSVVLDRHQHRAGPDRAGREDRRTRS